MKHLLKLLLATVFLSTSSIVAQNYTFEYTYNGWQTTQGSLSLSAEHAKEGTRSLKWSTQGESRLEISGLNISTTATNSANMYIYSPERTNDTLVVEFLQGETLQKRGTYLFNYKGWHEFLRWYKHYEQGGNATFNRVLFTLKPTTNTPRTIYFDAVELNRAGVAKKDRVGSHWLLDSDALRWATLSALGGGGYSATKEDPFLFASFPRDIPITSPTAEELAAIQQIRKTFKPTASYDASSYAKAATYVEGLNLSYNADGTLATAPVLPAASSNISINTYISPADKGGILAHLVALSGGVIAGKEGARDYFNKLFDYIIDQGFGEGAPIHARSNSYDSVRGITSAWIAIIAGCSDDIRYNEALHALRWFSYYGAMYAPEDIREFCISSDVLYLASRAIITTIACDKNDATAVRDMKAYKRYLERGVSYIPGLSDMLKPDGTGFHHGVHYINYMRAYTTTTEAFGWLKGTPFRVSREAYEHLRRAVITIYTMATTGKKNANMYALSHCGRHPFGNNHQVSYRDYNFETLIQVGRDCLGTPTEPIAEGAYNYFFQSNKYNVPPTPYEGFYAFNYDPSGIYRKDNWVITMRTPTHAFFGSELYVRTNRLGRYQANGTLEVLYNGTTLGASGYPTDRNGGGWDWNSPSGGTTVHFNNWKELMPNGDLTTRHDQHGDGTNFSGGLSFGASGIYGATYKQRESWMPTSRSNYAGLETHLSFKKSYYCFDGMVIALGSNISTSGDYPDNMLTATTLFQEIVQAPTQSQLQVNGNAKCNGYREELSTTNQNAWIITPLGTGYFIPRGVNNPLMVTYQEQRSPQHTGADVAAPTTTLTAVKAHFAHGCKTTNSSYHYVLRPNATEADMESISRRLEDGELYTVEQQDGVMHRLYYHPTATRAYSIFEAIDDIEEGVVKSVSTPLLLMDREGEAGVHHLAVCDPCLHPTDDKRATTNHELLFHPSTATITLRGSYFLTEPVEGVLCSEPHNGVTTVTVALEDGLPRYFSITTTPPASTSQTEMEAWATMREEPENLVFSFANTPDTPQVAIYSSMGRSVALVNGSATQKSITIITAHIPSGIYVCRVSLGEKRKSFKWIKHMARV